MQEESGATDVNSAMDTSEPAKEDYNVMQDSQFLQSVLETLPGVDPNNEATQNVMGSLASQVTKDGVGVRSESLKNMPPWHADYFYLETIKAQQTQKEFVTSPLPA